MMTPKEKARLLIDRFNHFDESYYHESFKDTDLGKQCALILVDEMINVFNPENWGLEMDNAFEGLKYWQEVKKEIELL